jgi:hypothetical protein
VPAPGEIRLGGELGRRYQLTVEKNLLALDLDAEFLRPFQQRVPFPWTDGAMGNQGQSPIDS